MPRPVQTHPMALLTVAREYADGASELLAIAATRPQTRGRQMPLSRPIYFLFSHAAELAFKAFLRANPDPALTVGMYAHDKITADGCRVKGIVKIPAERFFNWVITNKPMNTTNPKCTTRLPVKSGCRARG